MGRAGGREEARRRGWTWGAKSEVSAMPSGYAAKISPCHMPLMHCPSSVHSVEEEPKKAERKVAML